MTIVLAAGVVFAGILGTALYGLSRVPAMLSALRASGGGVSIKDFLAVQAAVERLEGKVSALPTLWEDYADRVDKSEKRAAYHVRRAQKIAAQNRADEELAELPGADAPGGEGEGVPAVHSGVGADPRLAALRRQIALM